MSTYEQGVKIIAEQLEAHRNEPAEQIARRCLEAFRKNRLALQRFRASEAMLRRFHAHARHLGNVTGIGYETIYNKAVNAAVKTEDWPVKIIPKRVRLDTGDIVEVDIPIPASSTKVTNGALLAAYAVIEQEAREHGIDLPEEEG
jgi:hypothetical protein